MQFFLNILNNHAIYEDLGFSGLIGIDENLNTLFFHLFYDDNEEPIVSYGTQHNEFTDIKKFEKMITDSLLKYNLSFSYLDSDDETLLIKYSNDLRDANYIYTQNKERKNELESKYLAQLINYYNAVENFDEKYCMYTDYANIECDYIISSHSVSSGNNLSNKIMHLAYSNKQGKFDISTSIKDKYSTVTNACHKHDDTIFSPIEKKNCIDYSNNEHINLIFYRTLFQEIYKIESKKNHLNKILNFNYNNGEHFKVIPHLNTNNLSVYSENSFQNEYLLNKENYIINKALGILNKEKEQHSNQYKRYNLLFPLNVTPNIINNTIFYFNNIIFYFCILKNKDKPFLLLSFKTQEEFYILITYLTKGNRKDIRRKKIILFLEFLYFFGNTGFNLDKNNEKHVKEILELLKTYKNIFYQNFYTDINILALPLENYIYPYHVLKNITGPYCEKTHFYFKKETIEECKKFYNIKTIIDSIINNGETMEVMAFLSEILGKQIFYEQKKSFYAAIKNLIDEYEKNMGI